MAPPAQTVPSRRRWTFRAAVVVLGALAGVSLVAAAELVLRVVRPPPPRSAMMDGYLAQQRAHMGRCEVGQMFHGDPRGPRIVVLGESSAQLLGQSLVALAEQPHAGFSVANCGDSGSGLVHLERRFEEALAVRPDAVVVVFGHNYGYSYPASPWALAALELRQRSRLAALIAGAPGEIPLCAAPPPPAPLAAALRRLVGEARRRGTRVVLSTVATNELYPPRCDQAPGPLDERVYRARLLRARGRAAEARDLLASAAAATRSARVEFELGLALDADGEAAGARASLAAAIEHDWHPGRASGAVNDAIRAAARSSGASLLDTAARVAGRQPDGVIGWESERDNCHLHDDLFGTEAVAALDLLGVGAGAAHAAVLTDPAQRTVAVLDFIANNVHGVEMRHRPDPGPAPAAFWRLIERDAPAVDELLAAWPDRRPDFTPRERAFWLAAAAEAYRLAGRVERVGALSDRAIAAADDVYWVWLWRGLYEVSRARPDAARAAFTRAVALYSHPEEARVYLSLL